jgi:hypothetical protein
MAHLFLCYKPSCAACGVPCESVAHFSSANADAYVHVVAKFVPVVGSPSVFITVGFVGGCYFAG